MKERIIKNNLQLEVKRLFVEENRDMISQRHVASYFKLSPSHIYLVIMGKRKDKSGIINYCYRLIECIKSIESTNIF